MVRKSPVLTATSALFLFMPVAKALGDGDSKTATSGMPMPAWAACFCTVFTSQISASERGCMITCAPVLHLAIHLDMASDMNDPPKPKTAAKISKFQ